MVERDDSLHSSQLKTFAFFYSKNCTVAYRTKNPAVVVAGSAKTTLPIINKYKPYTIAVQ